jgi:hypothetical protein
VKAAGSEDCEAYLFVYIERFERLRTKLGAFPSNRLVVHFNLKSEIFNHAPDFGGWLAWCGEVTVHEDGVRWIEGQGLEAAEIMFAASGDAEFGAWVQEPEEAEYF